MHSSRLSHRERRAYGSEMGTVKVSFRYVGLAKTWFLLIQLGLSIDGRVYHLYGLTDEEIAFIESMIKPME